MDGWRRLVPVVVYVLAAILIGRATVTQNEPFSEMQAYAEGHAAMPFQARYMMAPVLRWSERSALVANLVRRLGYSTRGPEDATMQVVDSLCMVLLGGLVLRMRRRMAPPAMFAWLAPALLLWMMALTFIVHYEQQLTMPYDFPAIVFFTVGILACMERRAIVFLAVMLVATYNRETSLFLLPIWLACAWDERRTQAILVACAGLAEWLLVRMQVVRWAHATTSGLAVPWRRNLTLVLHPQHWPQLLCVAGLIALPMWLGRGLIEDQRLRRVWLGASAFLLGVMVFGVWNETRILGELVPLAACTAAVQFEVYLAGPGKMASQQAG
jgi:hypothetical protein